MAGGGEGHIAIIPADGHDIAGAFAGDQDDGPKLPPPEPAVPPGKWIKDNLFSSVGSVSFQNLRSILSAGISA